MDDQTFVISVLEDGGQYRSKKDEGYESIVNVFDPPSGYNYDLSPGNLIPNWYKHLSSLLIRSISKVLKFNGGEVNYLMETTKTGEPVVVENSDKDLTNVEPDYDPEAYIFKGVITENDIDLLLATPYGYIEVYDPETEELLEGFIDEINYDPDDVSEFNLLK